MRPIDRPIKTKVEHLRVGMFVDLPGSWLEHAFVRSSFLIKDQAQISKIKQSGIQTVMVDPLKSLIRPHSEKAINYVKKDPPKKVWDSPLMPNDFSAILKDAAIPPKQKASYVYNASLDVMDKLLKNPTIDNITQFKDGVSDMVDLILVDDETASHLLNITSHDYYTFTHSVNVGVLSVLLTKVLYGASSPHNMQELGAAFFLHDIGKVHVPDALIQKPGRLDESELSIMREHPLSGYQILSDTDHLSLECKIIVMQHHERDDGSGYPQGLMGEEIHVYGRICTIADVFDALTSRRPYKKALSLYDSLLLMKGEMGNHFNPEIFSAFVQLFKT